MRTGLALACMTGLILAVGMGAAACGDLGPSAGDVPDSGLPDAPRLDASGLPEPVDGDAPDAAPEAGDVTPPGRVSDLAGTSPTSSTVVLTWTAPTDEHGMAAAYDVRVSKTAITTEAELLAATALPVTPTPGAPGAPQTATVSKLDADTDYHFALRARDAAGNWSAPSNDATVRTKARASFLVTEVAVANAAVDGFDFVELTATKAGYAEGIAIKQLTTALYTLGALDVVVGDRIVVHATALPGPTGFAQEDATRNKTASTAAFASAAAYDVYSATSGLTATDNVIAVVDGTTTLDAVAFSNRDGAVATATMTAFAKAKTDGSWSFAATPVDGTNDCETEGDAVNVATAAAETACGGFKSTVAAGFSLNRKGVTDTGSKADFYLAAQTPGAANAPIPAPTLVSAVATSATGVDLLFDQEIAPASAVAASFTVAGLNVSAASPAFNHVVLTTAAQAEGGYDVVLAPTVTNLQGVPPAVLTTHFCGYALVPALLTLSEVNPNLPGSTDLIELAVTRGGPLTGFTLRLNPTTTAGASGTLLATLPAICATTGDLVVVHLTPAMDPATSETLAKDQFAVAAYSQNYDGAWDVRGGTTGLATTNQVLTLRDPSGAYVEGVAFSNGSATSAASLAAMAFLQAQGLWTPPDCGGVACDDASVPTAQAISASWAGVGNTAGGISCQRTGATKDATSWTTAPSTFGASN